MGSRSTPNRVAPRIAKSGAMSPTAGVGVDGDAGAALGCWAASGAANVSSRLGSMEDLNRRICPSARLDVAAKIQCPRQKWTGVFPNPPNSRLKVGMGRALTGGWPHGSGDTQEDMP